MNESTSSPRSRSSSLNRTISTTSTPHAEPSASVPVASSSAAAPAAHQYLGNDLETIHERTFLEPNTYHQLVLFPLHNVILFPGESIPLRIDATSFQLISELTLFNVDRDAEITTYRTQQRANLTTSSVSSSANSIHVGVISFAHQQGQASESLSLLGTTAEVTSRSKLSSPSSSNFPDHDDFVMMARGRHRFEVVRLSRSQRLLLAIVKVLADYEMPNNRKERTRMDPFPEYIYKTCSPRALAKAAWNLFDAELNPARDCKWGHDSTQIAINSKQSTIYDVKTMAELEPNLFSYFLSANLPLTDKNRLSLLRCDNVVERLRLCIKFLRRSQGRLLGCAVCRSRLASIDEVFTVPGAEGMVGAYVNPHGCVHQTVTLRKLLPAARTYREGRPTEQDSWFPGYAWTILYCRVCHNHLGWHFTSTAPDVALRPVPATMSAVPPRESLADRLLDLMRILRRRNDATERGLARFEANIVGSSAQISDDYSMSEDSVSSQPDRMQDDDDEFESADEGDISDDEAIIVDAADDEYFTPRNSTQNEMSMNENQQPVAAAMELSDVDPDPAPESDSSRIPSLNMTSQRTESSDEPAIEASQITGHEFQELMSELLPTDAETEKVPEFWGMRRAAIVELCDGTEADVDDI